MLDNIIRVHKHSYYFPNTIKSINVKSLGDIHFCGSFDESKLRKIESVILTRDTNYTFINGDVVDSTNFLYENKRKRDLLLGWLERLGKNNETFITLGSHDFSFGTSSGWSEDWDHGFWKEVSELEGVHVSHYESFYEDDKIVNLMLEPDFGYYYKSYFEDKEALIKLLEKNAEFLRNLPQEKVKFVQLHSPIYAMDKDVLDYLREYNFILSGHMHNGCVPPILDKLPTTIGLIAPNKFPLPRNARGTKSKVVGENSVNLIVSGGITKLQECAGVLEKFNGFYTMDIDDITIEGRQKALK